MEGDSLAVPRSINEAAHLLALEGRRRKFFGDWLTGVPDSVRVAALQDRLAWDQRN